VNVAMAWVCFWRLFKIPQFGTRRYRPDAVEMQVSHTKFEISYMLNLPCFLVNLDFG
jgi:hypothetical protein